MLTLLAILAVFLQIAIALTMYFRRKGGHTNTIFMLLSLALAGWAAANYIAISVPQNSATIYAIRTVITFVIIQNTLFYLFTRTFPNKKIRELPRHDKYVVGASIVLVVLSQTPLLFQSVEIRNGTANPLPGPAIMLFMLHALFTITIGLRTLFKRYRESMGQKRDQLLLILLASSVLWLIAPITNFVITLVAKTTIFVQVSPFYTLVFAGFITYAIVAAHLFDIRSAIARSVGYLMALGVIAVAYTVIVYNISIFFFSGSQFSARQSLVYIIFALASATMFTPVRGFFDRITNRIFYRDSYDPQTFLDQLNDTIVNNIELGILLRHTSAVIQQNFKADFVQIGIRETDATPLRILGTQQSTYNENETTYLRAQLDEMPGKLVIVDDIPHDQSQLRRIMRKHNVAFTVRLTATYYGQEQSIAYLIFGSKKSGNIYTKQDFRIIDIISDELVIAIQNALRFEEIQEFNATLQQKVNEATNKLKRTNEKLKAIDETKDEFISMASHQLRTPLTSVKGYLSMVIEGDAGKLTKAQEQLLTQAFTSSQRMVYLIADLLNVSRLKTGKFILDTKPTNLADVVEGEIAQLTEQAKAKNLTLTYDKPADFPTMSLDETKIRQVIMNFADNAVYYTPKGGKIKIELKSDKSHVYFMVKDNGLGVPKDEQKQLFGKFFRASNARMARPDGTGLGLFMAKKVVTAQGGNILFESKAGEGSTFGFSFERAKIEPKEPATANETAEK